MNDMTHAELDEILLEFVATDDVPNWATVQEWMQRYPKYAQEIAEFAAAWILSETMPANPETAAMPMEHWLAASRRGFERAVAESRALYDGAPLNSLSDAARAAGLTPAALAKKVGATRALLGGMDQRIIRGVRAGMIDRLAVALQRSRESIAAYLQQPPTLATSNAYKAEKTPTLKETMTFDEAVRADPNLSADEKDALLRLEP